jgi:polysaccharide biosynthesis protein PslH
MKTNTRLLAIVPYQVHPAKMGGQKGIALFYQHLGAIAPIVVAGTNNNRLPADLPYEFQPILGSSSARYANLFLLFKLRVLIRQQQITYLIIEHPYFGWLGVLLKWLTGVQLVVHSHNIEALRFKSVGKWWWRILWQYEKWTHRRANYNFFIQDDDRQYALQHFGLAAKACTTITYGITNESTPTALEKQEAAQWIRQQHQLSVDAKILLFNGAFNYFPNLDALQKLVHDLLPQFNQQLSNFALIICGKDIPQSIKEAAIPNLVIAGFVDDINIYFKGADLFLNPIVEGGGIKTKLVEGLSANTICVSTFNGAIGVSETICGGNLLIAKDDLSDFVAKTVEALQQSPNLPTAFFDHFSWKKIVAKALSFIGNAKV